MTIEHCLRKKMRFRRHPFLLSTKLVSLAGAFLFGITAEAQNKDTSIHLGFDWTMDKVRPIPKPGLSGGDEVWLTLHPNGSLDERHAWGGRIDTGAAKLGGALSTISSWHVRSANILERFQSFPNNTRSWRISVEGGS